MAVMQTRPDGVKPPKGRTARPTKARRKGKAGAPRRKPAVRKNTAQAG